MFITQRPYTILNNTTPPYTMQLQIIAHAHNGFSQKFGIPRQSREDSCIETRIIFTHTYRVREALRGIDGYSHLWLLWGFHEAKRRLGEEEKGERLEARGEESWSPTVRPPRLGGNKRMGVFATRSPFRPNPIGLTSVKLLRVEDTANNGLVLVVSGADLLDGTPIYDIKPYVAYCDSHPGARSGFVDEKEWKKLDVEFPGELSRMFDAEDFAALCKVLELDPRPQYHNDPERLYGMPFGAYDIKFTVSQDGVLKVMDVVKR